MSDTLSPNLRMIGRYSILRELRRDRYSVSYAAFDPVLNRELIVKAVQLHAASGETSAGYDRIEQAFARQAQAAGRMHHAHIVTVFDAGRVKSIGYLAIEQVDGKLLDEMLNEGFRAGFLQAADIMARVADAVEFAHSRGVPHGHLSPSQIYLQSDRMPKVMGFGGWVDAGEGGDFALSITESVLPYFQNELSPAARRHDVQALGALLFLLLTGKRPDIRALQARKDKSESVILAMRPSTPVALAEIADEALELNSSRSFATAAQMRNALTSFLYGARGEVALPQAATITGMPVRLEFVARTPATLVGAAAKDAPSPALTTATRSKAQLFRINRALAGSVAGAAAMLAVVIWLVLHPTNDSARPLPESAEQNQTSLASASALTTSPLRASVISAPAETSALSSTSKPADTPRNASVPIAMSTPVVAAGKASDNTGARAAKTAARQAIPIATPLNTTGQLTLAVAPWGEVFIDGASRGISPPLTQLTLPAGRHTIEVRNGQSPPLVTQLEVKADRPQQIRHRFP